MLALLLRTVKQKIHSYPLDVLLMYSWKYLQLYKGKDAVRNKEVYYTLVIFSGFCSRRSGAFSLSSPRNKDKTTYRVLVMGGSKAGKTAIIK